MKATHLFDQWVDLGKDDGMEINHRPSAHYMLSLVLDHVLNREFSFLDFGCGNGWLVRQVSQMKTCSLAVGIDGSEKVNPEKIPLQSLKGQMPLIVHPS